MTVTDEWAGVSGKAVPYVCRKCGEKPKQYYGRLVFPSDKETPLCPNHKVPLDRVR